MLVISAISQTDSWSLQAGLVPFSSPAHLSGKEPYNECLQGAGNRVNIGVINYGGRKRWQSNPMIIVAVEMRSHAHTQGHSATDNGKKKKKQHILCPLTLSLCRTASPAADRAEKELVNIVFGRGHRAEIMGERKQVKWREKTFKWYCYHQGRLGWKQRVVEIYMVYFSKKKK